MRVFLDRLDAMEQFLGGVLELLNLAINSNMKDLRTLASLLGGLMQAPSPLPT